MRFYSFQLLILGNLLVVQATAKLSLPVATFCARAPSTCRIRFPRRSLWVDQPRKIGAFASKCLMTKGRWSLSLSDCISYLQPLKKADPRNKPFFSWKVFRLIMVGCVIAGLILVAVQWPRIPSECRILNAIQDKNFTAVKRIIRANPQLRTRNFTLDNEKYYLSEGSLLHLAAQVGDYSIFCHLCDLDEDGSDWKDANNLTPIHFLAAANHVDCLEYVLKKPNFCIFKDYEDRQNIEKTAAYNPVQLAVLASSSDCLKVLLKHEPRFLELKTSKDDNLLHLAVQPQNLHKKQEALAVTRQLLACEESDGWLLEKNADHLTPTEVKYQQCPKAIKALLQGALSKARKNRSESGNRKGSSRNSGLVKHCQGTSRYNGSETIWSYDRHT